MPFRYVSRRAQMIKSFYSGIGKTAVIVPAAFLAGLGLGTLILGMVFYLRVVYRATGGQLGAFFGLWSFAYILGCLLLRPLTDSIRPRYLLAASTFCMFLCTLALHYCGSFVLAYVFYSFVAVSAGLFWPPLMGWLSSDLEGADLSKAMSRFNLSWSMGAIISPFLAGWLAELDVALPLQVAAAIFLLTSFLVAGAALALPRVRNDRHSAVREQGSGPDADESTRLRYSTWVGVFTAFVALGSVIYIFPVSAREELNIREGVIGMLFSSRAFCTTLAFAVMGRTVFWHHKSSQILLGQLWIVGLLVAMVYVRQPLTIGPVLACLGLGVGLSYFNSMFHSIAGSSNRVARSAVHESLLSAGLLCGAVLGGVLYQYYSITVVYLTCAALVLAGVVVQAGISLWVMRVEKVPQRVFE